MKNQNLDPEPVSGRNVHFHSEWFQVSNSRSHWGRLSSGERLTNKGAVRRTWCRFSLETGRFWAMWQVSPYSLLADRLPLNPGREGKNFKKQVAFGSRSAKVKELYKIAWDDLILMGIGAQWSLQGGALGSCVIKPGIAQRRMDSCRRSLPEKGMFKKQEAGQSSISKAVQSKQLLHSLMVWALGVICIARLAGSFA